MADKKDDAPAVFDEPKRWQVKFKSGQGQQVALPTEAAVRKHMTDVYGPEYEIESVTEITPKPVK